MLVGCNVSCTADNLASLETIVQALVVTGETHNLISIPKDSRGSTCQIVNSKLFAMYLFIHIHILYKHVICNLDLIILCHSPVLCTVVYIETNIHYLNQDSSVYSCLNEDSSVYSCLIDAKGIMEIVCTSRSFLEDETKCYILPFFQHAKPEPPHTVNPICREGLILIKVYQPIMHPYYSNSVQEGALSLSLSTGNT